MDNFKIKGEYIHLNQLLKVLGWVNDGAMANEVIDAGLVNVDGVVETRRRNKIRPEMKITFDGKNILCQ